MAKQSADVSEVEAVAREIFTATVIPNLRAWTPEFIVEKAFQCAEVFVAYKQAYRQNTAKVKGTEDAV